MKRNSDDRYLKQHNIQNISNIHCIEIALLPPEVSNIDQHRSPCIAEIQWDQRCLNLPLAAMGC